MVEEIIVKPSPNLYGTVDLVGAKNSVLVSMASLILTDGISTLTNVPASDDVWHMMQLLQDLGADVHFSSEEHILTVDTRPIRRFGVCADIMKKMRASVLVMGPLLARFGRADIALPGGCVIGARPIDYHLAGFKKMGAQVLIDGELLSAVTEGLVPSRLILEYPSVGATENLLMAATLCKGQTKIINAAIEPEILDLVDLLKKMGACITVEPPATICVEGVDRLYPVEHSIMYDRLEAGSLLLAAAVTGGQISLPDAPAYSMDTFLAKLEEMGHNIQIGSDGVGVSLQATNSPKAVSFKTAPFPGFPTDLQAPMMVAQCLASGRSIAHETVFENRLIHAKELNKMGAQISVEYNKATIIGVENLYGSSVIATDIRAACALIIAGLVAKGATKISGLHHLTRGYENLPSKLIKLGANISNIDSSPLELNVTKKEVCQDLR